MKSIIICFISFLVSISSQAQIDEPIINAHYPFKGAQISAFPNTMGYGVFLFKSDIDYFMFQSVGKFNPELQPAFFSYDEMGVIISKKMTSGCVSYKIESVIETHDKIIINMILVAPSFRTQDVIDYMICLRLKKSNKEVYVSESIQEIEVPESKFTKVYTH